jgi:AmiR/NasT family two-component response regulator
VGIVQAEAAREAKQRDNQLQHALDSRVIIEQAKGMLAEQAQIDLAAAFNRLRTHARNTNTQLTAVASQIVNHELQLDRGPKP